MENNNIMHPTINIWNSQLISYYYKSESDNIVCNVLLISDV